MGCLGCLIGDEAWSVWVEESAAPGLFEVWVVCTHECRHKASNTSYQRALPFNTLTLVVLYHFLTPSFDLLPTPLGKVDQHTYSLLGYPLLSLELIFQCFMISSTTTNVFHAASL